MSGEGCEGATGPVVAADEPRYDEVVGEMDLIW